MTDEQALRLTLELLEGESTLVLATSGGDGFPRATPVFFCADLTLELAWYSSPQSTHSRNLISRPQASVSIYAPVQDWRGIRGVQMIGVARERPFDPAPYMRKFQLGPELRPAIERSAQYVFQPRWLRYIDNAYGFGFQHEVTLGSTDS